MSIDVWTIGFELVNFLVLVWILERLLYRPVLGVIGRRQAEIERLQQADAAVHQALTAEREGLEQAQRALADERARALEEAHAQAREERARLETEAHAEMEKLLVAGRARLEQERADADRALRCKSIEVGVGIARRLLSLSTPVGGDGRFVEAVCARLQSLDARDHARLVAGMTERSVVRVVTAEPLDPEQQQHCRERIEQALECTVDMRFTVDSSLIAGIEVHFPGLALRHSWSDALTAGESRLAEAAEQAETEAGEDGRDAS